MLSKLEDIVKNLSFVSEKDGKVIFTFETERTDDIREDVSFALSDARLLVLSMNEEKKSLEDTYLAIMKDSDEKYEEELRLAEEEDEEDEEDDDDEYEYVVVKRPRTQKAQNRQKPKSSDDFLIDIDPRYFD